MAPQEPKTKIFTLDPKITRDQVVQAVYDVRLKKWEKTRQGDKPDIRGVRGEFEKTKTAEDVLMRATSGLDHVPGIDHVFNEDEARAIGEVLLQVEKGGEKKGLIHPDTYVMGSNGKRYTLEPKELPGWLLANARAGEVIPVDEWVYEHDIGLTSHGSSLKNGKEELYLEIHDGQSRVVGNGSVTKKMDGYYGGVKGVTVGDGDLLDIYISKDIHTQIAGDKESGVEPKPYEGKVFVMQQVDKGQADEMKIGFAGGLGEFRHMMTSTWDKPKDFADRNEGMYAEMTHKQYDALKEALKKNPKLTLAEFAGKNGIKLIPPQMAQAAQQEFDGVPEQGNDVDMAPQDGGMPAQQGLPMPPARRPQPAGKAGSKAPAGPR